MKAPLHLETPRLALSPPTASDAESIFECYAGDPDVTRFLGWPRHRSVAETREFLDFSALEWDRSPAGPYLIRLRADGRLIGGTGLSFKNEHEAVTGYVLAKDAWGSGLRDRSAPGNGGPRAADWRRADRGAVPFAAPGVSARPGEVRLPPREHVSAGGVPKPGVRRDAGCGVLRACGQTGSDPW